MPATISGRRWATYDQVEAFLAVAAGSSTVGEALAEVGCEWWQIAGRCARHADLLTRLRESMALLREQRAAAVADHAAAVVLGHQRFRTITSADGKKSTIDEANPALARLVIEHDDPEFVVRRRNGDQPAATTNVLVLGVDSVRAILEAPAGSSLRPPRIVECAVDPPDAQLVAPQQSDSTPHTGAAHKRDVHSSSTPQRPADE